MKKLLTVSGLCLICLLTSCGSKSSSQLSSEQPSAQDICQYGLQNVKRQLAKKIGKVFLFGVASNSMLLSPEARREVYGNGVSISAKDIDYLASKFNSKITKAILDKKRSDKAYCSAVMKLSFQDVAGMPTLARMVKHNMLDVMRNELKKQTLYALVDYEAVYQAKNIVTAQIVNSRELTKEQAEKLLK